MNIFVTGIGTEIGKTVISSILTENLQADYWKPIQSGDLDFTDSMKVKALISNSKSVFHQERYSLSAPMSPHASAAIDGLRMDLTDFYLPKTVNHLVVEGAGGLMVPINEQDMMIDLVEQLGIPVVLVSKNYLGSINHTMLSIQELNRRKIAILGIVFNGEPNPASEQFILNYSKLPCLFRVGMEEEINQQTIARYAQTFKI
jgi:dethiobiotin synthetase